MIETSQKILLDLGKKWKLISWISYGITALAIGMFTGELLHRIFGFSYAWILPVFLLAFIFILIFSVSWRVSPREIIRFLDTHYPSMEESAGLLLSEPDSSGSLVQLQRMKIGAALQREYPAIQFPPKIRKALIFFAVVCSVMLAFEGIFYFFSAGKPWKSGNKINLVKQVPVLPVAGRMQIQILPPSYTRVAARQQEEPDILAEEGATIDWKLKTDQPVHSVKFVFDDSSTELLQPLDTGYMEWGLHRNIHSSGFYQLNIDSEVSDHYKMEMIRDLFPDIEVLSPKTKTVLEYGMSEEVPLRVTIRDDYGVQSADIFCTISSGSGEAVKFTEKQIRFSESFSAMHEQYALQKTLDLGKLGMIPGDELYFYIRAKDNHGQEKKSGIFMVTLADTAELMSSELAVSGLNIKPEYFRSERQIILETQQLLSDHRTLGTEAFNNKSNDLGVDQKMLRLRYGKFLGEEEESNEQGPGNQNAVNDPANFGNAGLVLDAYTDKHDNAADASFFEKETKDQLKAVLNEMWSAELQLRTFKPEAALPIEYRALRLLKDLQQKSRVYVAKTGYKTTPLDLGKRLSGELGRIQNPVEEQEEPDNPGSYTDLRAALGILQMIPSNNKKETASLAILQGAGGKLREKAMEEPSAYLASYTAMQKILNALKTGSDVSGNDIQLVENALQKLIKPMSEIPSAPEHAVNEGLSDYYFRNLNKFP